jgi:GNAT superfamily N-acetyltransferase
MRPPSSGGLAAALTWLGERSPSYLVTTRARHATHPVFCAAGLAPAHELPAYVCDRLVAPREVPGLAVRPPRSAAEFLTAYGEELAPLVTAADLADADHAHLVGLLHGEVAGCALARHVHGTGHVSAVTVRQPFRRRGVGAALTAAATRTAVGRGWTPVWLHATRSSAPIYERLGYRRVDVHVQLGPG